MNRPRALVFDLDDTLYLQADFKHSGFRVVAGWLRRNQGLSEQGVLAELETILEKFGPSYPLMFDELARRLNFAPQLIPTLVEEFIGHDPKIECFAGIKELLTRLRACYPLGLLTDGRAGVQRKKIRALGLENAFDKIVCSDEWGLEKPAAELFETFEKAFCLPGADLVYVGDNPVKDFIGARRRGWTTLRVLTGEYAVREAQGDQAADVDLASAHGVEPWLEGLSR